MGAFDELYYRRPAVFSFDAEVTGCSEIPSKKAGAPLTYAVTLSETAFYPEGGGQPADTGTLGCAVVSDVQKNDGEIRHITDRALEVGAAVHGTIDEAARTARTQNHSGEHILSGIIHNRYGYDNVGFHMSDVITIDFNGVLSWEELMACETEANRVIRANLPVIERFPSEEELAETDFRSKKELTGEVRLIEIPGADLCACCGTHVRTTGEVGLLKCLSLSNYKGGVRIEMVCGEQALLAMQGKTEREMRIARLLSVKPEQSADAVESLLSEIAELKKAGAETTARYFALKADGYPGGEPLLIDWEETGDPADIRRFCDLLVKNEKASVCAVLAPAAAGGFNYVIGSNAVSLREEAKPLNEALAGRGGGSPQMIQGTFRAEKAAIEAALTERFGKAEASA